MTICDLSSTLVQQLALAVRPNGLHEIGLINSIRTIQKLTEVSIARHI